MLLSLEWRKQVDAAAVRVEYRRVAMAPEGVPGGTISHISGIEDRVVDPIDVVRVLAEEGQADPTSIGRRLERRVERTHQRLGVEHQACPARQHRLDMALGFAALGEREPE